MCIILSRYFDCCFANLVQSIFQEIKRPVKNIFPYTGKLLLYKNRDANIRKLAIYPYCFKINVQKKWDCNFTRVPKRCIVAS